MNVKTNMGNSKKRNGETKVGDRPADLSKIIADLVKGNKVEDIKKVLSDALESRKIDLELVEGGFNDIAALHDLWDERNELKRLSVQKGQEANSLQAEMDRKHPTISKVYFTPPQQPKKTGEAAKLAGETSKDGVLLCLSEGMLDLNSLTAMVGDFEGKPSMNNDQFKTARSGMYNKILPYLESKGLIERSKPSRGSTRFAWVTKKGITYLEGLNNVKEADKKS